MKKNINQTFSKITSFCKSYIELSVWMLVFAVGIRFFETILLTQKNNDFPSNMGWNMIGLCYDITLFLRMSSGLIILFVAVSFLNEKIARKILQIILCISLFLSLTGVVFFVNSGFLLDKIVFTYSVKELWDIFLTYNSSSFWVYVVVVCLPILFFFVSKKRIKINLFGFIVFFVLTFSSFFIFRKLPTDINQYHVKKNKIEFFWKSMFQKKSVLNEDEKDIIEAIQEFRSYFPEHQFLETDFPFLYQTNQNDILSSFFNLKDEPPNFVFIIVEGLSYEYLYNDYELMPFLYNLSQQSLRWEHCLSVSARTFGVLPALFGAAPLGNEGFMYQCPNNPNYHSLLKILHNNGYTNHFFYGGWIGFDNMEHFLNQNSTTYLKRENWEQDIMDKRLNVSYGYEDHLVYVQALRKLNQTNENPRVDIFLSRNTHVPFEYPNSEHFQKIVKNRVNQNKTLSYQCRKEILTSIDVYGSFAYSDWAMEQLMADYKKREDYENTIFIITGDHHAFAKQFAGYANYHVPLIIYSPMLKNQKIMKGVVSHRDITPSLLALLKKNYEIEIPNEVAWLNSELDTSSTFQAQSFSPLQLIDHTIGGVMYKNYLLCENILEKFIDGGTQKINNPEVFQKMNRFLSLYRKLDYYAFSNDALLRSDEAFRYKNAKTVIIIEDTIAVDSYFAKDSQLKVTEGPENHPTTLYFDGSYLYPITFLTYYVPNDIEEFRVDIEFKIYIKNKTLENFWLVVDFLNIFNNAETLDYDKQNQWYSYKHSFTYNKELWQSLENQCQLKIYLWNHHKLEGYIDDIMIKVRVL